nr:matrix metalloproteinase-17-like [Procambarus clarkii]
MAFSPTLKAALLLLSTLTATWVTDLTAANPVRISSHSKSPVDGLYLRDDPDAHTAREEVTHTPMRGPVITPPPHLNFSTPAPKKGSTLSVIKFMEQFGYVQKSDNVSGALYTEQSLEEYIMKLQKFGNIPQTGVVDNATLELIATPRCGRPDLETSVPKDSEDHREPHEHIRRKRYIVGGLGWEKRRLTYHLANWSPQLKSKENVQKELRKAFDAWSVYSHLQFSEVDTGDADIIIYFASYDHYDGYPFDGPSGILAHAYYPYEFGSYGGDVHFDESEKWNIRPKDEYSGLDFFTVAVHEIGHSLGLAHSPVSGSIMFPYYKGYTKHFALDYDDVMAMWELYIKRKLDGDDEYFNSTTTTTTTTPAYPDDDHQADAAGDDNPEGKSPNPDDNEADDDNNVLKDEAKDWDEATDSDEVSYRGDYETVDQHRKRVQGGWVDDLPGLPHLPPEGDGAHGRKEDEEEDFYAEDRKRREEEEKRREEDRKREEEDEAERRRSEEDIKRREEETRRREEEARRRWEEEWEARGGEEPEDTPPGSEPRLPNLCHGSYDAMALLRQELFIFKDQYVWRYSERRRLRDGYPTLIRNLFPALPSFLKKINAVYERPSDSNIIFFIGKYYYVHDGDRLVEGSPRPLTSLGLPELQTSIDAAFHWPRADKTYFFSKNWYFRYNEKTRQMDPGYPKDISKWNGLPSNLDAAFTFTDGLSYFIRGYQYWKYDNVRIEPYSEYPKDAPEYWAGCPPGDLN